MPGTTTYYYNSSDEENSDEEMRNSESSDESDGEDENEVWRELLQEVVEDLPTFPGECQNIEELLLEPKFTQYLLSPLEEKLTECLDLGTKIRDSDFYEALANTAGKLEKEDDFTEEEAMEAAWEKRVNLAKKKIIEPNLDLFNEWFEEGSVESSDNGKEEMDEADTDTDDDGDDDEFLWKSIMRDIAALDKPEELPEHVTKASDLLVDPQLHTFVYSKLCAYVTDAMEKFHAIEVNTVYEKIEEAKDGFLEDDYEEDEAMAAAIDKHKYLIKFRVIKPNLDLLKPLFADEDEEEA